MLVLTRKRGQSIVIGSGEITVEVLEIRCNQVRLGLSAPSHIQIDRAELRREKGLITVEATAQEGSTGGPDHGGRLAEVVSGIAGQG